MKGKCMKGIVEVVVECLSALLVFFRRRKSKRDKSNEED